MDDYFCVAIPHGSFWIRAKDRKIALFSSGIQRVSMSRLSRATVAVLSDPDAYRNRPAYFADYTLSTNKLLALLKEVAPGWKVENVPVESQLSRALQNWDEDSANGVEDR